MPSLKELRTRIKSVKSTRKITSAMKMVAASKLRQAQEEAENSRPYAHKMQEMVASLVQNIASLETVPSLLLPSQRDEKYLYIVITSNRGLCGAFNTNLVRFIHQKAKQDRAQGKKVFFYCIGRRGHEQLKYIFGDQVIKSRNDFDHATLDFVNVRRFVEELIAGFENGDFDRYFIGYNQFCSPLIQLPRKEILLPLSADSFTEERRKGDKGQKDEGSSRKSLESLFEFEPKEHTILSELLPQSIAMRIYQCLLESFAGEYGARMMAMDGATRNADDMTKRLTLNYNQARQAYITKELIEIISGAEAL